MHERSAVARCIGAPPAAAATAATTAFTVLPLPPVLLPPLLPPPPPPLSLARPRRDVHLVAADTSYRTVVVSGRAGRRTSCGSQSLVFRRQEWRRKVFDDAWWSFPVVRAKVVSHREGKGTKDGRKREREGVEEDRDRDNRTLLSFFPRSTRVIANTQRALSLRGLLPSDAANIIRGFLEAFITRVAIYYVTLRDVCHVKRVAARRSRVVVLTLNKTERVPYETIHIISKSHYRYINFVKRYSAKIIQL